MFVTRLTLKGRSSTPPDPEAGKITLYADDTGDVRALNDEGDSSSIISERTDAYADTGHSHQSIWADLDLTANNNAGDSTNPKFIAAIMGNVLADATAKTKNYLAGVIGHFTATGTNATTYPSGAVLAGIGDGVTDVAGAVVAYIDGDDSTTTAGAAFKVMNNNSTAASGFDFGVDLQDAAHDGFQPVDSAFYNKAPLRLVSDVCIFVVAGIPVDYTDGSPPATGETVAGPGSLAIDSTNSDLYINTGTKAQPLWTKPS